MSRPLFVLVNPTACSSNPDNKRMTKYPNFPGLTGNGWGYANETSWASITRHFDAKCQELKL